MQKPSYIPVSLLAELAYCPRNFYYRAVEFVEDTNYYMEKGRIEEEKRKKRMHIKRAGYNEHRFLYLSSDNLKITGVIDAVRDTGEIFPVEYKTGELRDSFPHDVQVCASAMLLEEALNIKIKKGVIFYSTSGRKREVILTEELREKVKELIYKAFEIIEEEIIPPPLYSDKCNGCSLYNLCMPIHETSRRKTFAGSDFKKVVYIDTPGASVRRKKGRLIVRLHKEEILSVPLDGIHTLVISGNVQVSTQLLRTLLKMRASIVYLTGKGEYLGTLYPEKAKNSILRLKQYKRHFDRDFCLGVGRRIVVGKIKNSRTILMRYERERKTGVLEEIIGTLAGLIHRAENAENIKELLGIEGLSARKYFEGFRIILKPEWRFDFTKREKRPPVDPVNSLLSLGYTLLFKNIMSAILTVGMEPFIGFYHAPKYAKPALALDLMEEWRPVIVDSLVLKIINKGVISSEDFIKEPWGCFLKRRARKKFYYHYEKKIREEIKHPIFETTLSYLRSFEIQARIMAKVITGEFLHYKPFVIR